MKLDKDIFKTTASIKVLVTVENIGSVAGSEVVQVYIATPTLSIVGIPANPLAGFAKTKLLSPEVRILEMWKFISSRSLTGMKNRRYGKWRRGA